MPLPTKRDLIDSARRAKENSAQKNDTPHVEENTAGSSAGAGRNDSPRQSAGEQKRTVPANRPNLTRPTVTDAGRTETPTTKNASDVSPDEVGSGSDGSAPVGREVNENDTAARHDSRHAEYADPRYERPDRKGVGIGIYPKKKRTLSDAVEDEIRAQLEGKTMASGKGVGADGKRRIDDIIADIVEKKISSVRADAFSPPANSQDWNDVGRLDVPDKGIGAEKPVRVSRSDRGSLRLRRRDLEVISFLARYKFATRSQIERHFGTEHFSRRLAQLRRAGYLWGETITRSQTLWTPSNAGLDLVDLDYPALSGGKITPSTIGHTLGLVNLGSDFETGKTDTMYLPEALHQNPEGERVVQEREISMSFKQYLTMTGDPRVLRSTNVEKWGSEPWTYVIHSTTKSHTPDLVLDRGGKGKDIAVELELSPKRNTEWKNILSMYKTSPYAHVIYYTHKRGIAGALNRINRDEVGMANFHVRTYNPLRSDIPFWG